MSNPFDESTLASVETLLADTDQLLEASYPRDTGARQPIHTVYVPGDKYTPDLPAAWGQNALVAAGGLVGLSMLATKLDLARAYIEMGDADGARDILDEVVAEGDDGQKTEARDMLSRLV